MPIPRIDRLDMNLLINGGLDLWQRHHSLSSAGELSGYHSVDRFRIATYNTAGTRMNHAQGGDKPNDLTEKSGLLGFTSTASASFDLEQRIESTIARRMANETVSFSAWFKTDEFRAIRLRMFTLSAKDFYGAGTLVSIYDQTFPFTNDLTWRQFKAENIPIPSSAVNGLAIVVSGVSPQFGAGARVFRYAQFMLNFGPRALPFVPAGFYPGDEIRLCQRYYEKSFNLDTPPAHGVEAATRTRAGTVSLYSNSYSEHVYYRTTKRIAANVGLYNPFSTTANIRSYDPATGTPIDDVWTVEVSTIHQFGILRAGVHRLFPEIHYTADAEL